MQVIQLQSIKNYIKHSHRLTISGIFAIFSLCLFTLATIFPLTSAEQRTEAATGTASNTSLTLSTTGGASLDLSVNNSNGTFATTDPTATGYTSTSTRAEFSVTTTNYTGYTLSISASDNTGTLTNSEDDNTTTNSIASIPTGSSLTAAQFNNTTYNGKWGYKPSMLNSATNINYLPAPTTTATTLDETNSPNTTANNYTIDLAARLQYTNATTGAYAKTFTLTAVGNPIDYTISYDGTGADSGTPATDSNATRETYMTISSTIPTREGYTFKGWCTTSTGTDGTDACAGTTYQPGDQYPIDQTTQNIATLYAVWEKDMPIMQDIASAELAALMPNTGDSTALKDSRDGQIYTVAKINGNYWMTRNLAIGCNGTDTTYGSDIISRPLTISDSNVISNTSTTSTAFDNSNNSSSTGYTTAAMQCNAVYGGYYNYAAATANTISGGANYTVASYDICPKNWRLPTRDEFSGITSHSSAFAPVYSGGYINGSPSGSGPGGYGWWWSSVANSGNNRYTLQYYIGSLSASYNYYDRYYGYSVRCVRKSDAEIDIETIQHTETMQSITNDQLATIMPNEGSKSSLRDARDDQVYTLAKINGNYWMTRNLAIGCNGTGSIYGSTIVSKSLKTSDSNVASDKSTTSTAFDSSNNSSSTGYDTAAMQCNATYGGHYNYAAATANTITGASNSIESTQDICPKNWRLPTNNELSGIISQSSGFILVYSGYYSNGSLYADYSGGGRWWSSTALDGANRFFLNYYTSSLNVSYSNRYQGLSIRCIHST